MGIVWSAEQKQVIDLRNSNLLVSAAAGSGKTTVLVERILSLITDPDHPLDIDRLLVVTFTRAAAADMKAKIGDALGKRLEADPENALLQRQSILLNHAQFSTIDSFCAYVLQNYFHKIDLDPGYRIAEEAEKKILAKRAIQETLEEAYEEAAPDDVFLRFMRAYAGTRDDEAVETIVQDLYVFSRSHPDPEDWLEQCRALYDAESEEQLEDTVWMQYLLQETKDRLDGYAQSLESTTLYIEKTAPCLQKYVPALQKETERIRALCGGQTYAALRKELFDLTWEKLPPVRTQDDTEKKQKETVQAVRKQIQQDIKKTLREQAFCFSAQEVLQELAEVRPYAEELIRLVRRYGVKLQEQKREKGVLDFDDMEHLALQIVGEKQADGSYLPTEVGRELADRFEAVMIDEYQDSNFLQEALLSCVARPESRCMVGDVKQSIYGFRQARPDLFLEKASRYRQKPQADTEDTKAEEGTLISLFENYRSRHEVLDSVNAVFRKLMVPELGGIVYDAEAELHPKASMPEHPQEDFAKTELLLLDKDAPDFVEEKDRESMTEKEARLVADRIRQLVRTGQVWDATAESYRPVQYRDCVVLLRKNKGWSESFVKILQEEGIPAYATSRTGYFSTLEVTTVLHALRLCDNPRQDIPMAAVLHSPMVGLTDEDLAKLHIASPESSFYDAVLQSQDEKIQTFLQQLDRYREEAAHTPVHQLIRKILRETGYGEYVAAMPAGAQRQANLEMLVAQAVAFEKTDQQGLFSFLRYMEELDTNKVDFGEQNIYGEEEDIVRIMTIHNSKGLEFPIVFLAGLDSAFNTNQEKAMVQRHSMLGMGLAAVYPDERRIHKQTPVWMAIKDAVHRDMLAEEMRILYVGMTRVKEKLVLVGAGSNLLDAPMATEKLTYQQLFDAKSYLDWIWAVLPGIDMIQKKILQPQDLVEAEITEQWQTDEVLQTLRERLTQGRPGAFSPEIRQFLQTKAAFQYPGERAFALPAKMTVSELKSHSFLPDADRETEEALFSEEIPAPYIPKFMQEQKEEGLLQGAARGTAYHRVFSVWPFTQGETISAESVQQEIRKMMQKGLLSEPEAAVIRAEDICRFLQSPLGLRMAKAAEEKTLQREQPFVLHAPAADLLSSADVTDGSEDEMILVQGTIDAYWKEQDGYILIDYKTDRVQHAQELVDRYQTQLTFYAKALTQITMLPVLETWIYSLQTGEAIPIP